MRLFGFEVTRAKAQTLSSVSSAGGWMNLIREPFSGAWQAVMPAASPREILAYSAVFSCVTIIASDISKLEIDLTRETSDGIEEEVRNSPYLPVLTKPNHYQTRLKFMEQWVVSKLLFGNAYVLKQRDARGIVTAMYLLDPMKVTVLVADSGDVFYQLAADNLNGLEDGITVPARDIIHDMMVSLWHPLVGVSPIYACAVSATQGNQIQLNSTKFFNNMSRPSGVLTAPGAISDEVAGRLKQQWEENFANANIGRLAVLGDGLKYEAMTIPAQEAQLIEQQKWTVEDVARCFHMPLFKIGGAVPSGSSIEALNQMYYSDCLQALIESIEACLDEGLALPRNYHVELCLDGLIRMDTAARYKALNDAVGGGWMSPNEAREREDLPPVEGGESPYLQQQNYSLAALAKRDAQADPFAPASTSTSSSGTEQDGSSSSASSDGATEDDEDDAEMLSALSTQSAALIERVRKELIDEATTTI